jgi:hypothetical protein
LTSAICRSSIQAALHAMQCAGVTCALASRLSEAPRAPVVMPAGLMPGPPGSCLRDHPRAPHPPRMFGSHPECALRWAGYLPSYCIRHRCQGRMKLHFAFSQAPESTRLLREAILILRGRPTVADAIACVTQKDSLVQRRVCDAHDARGALSPRAGRGRGEGALPLAELASDRATRHLHQRR